MVDSVTFGSSVNGSNFTIDATTQETEDGLVVYTDDGSMMFTKEDTVVFESSNPAADTLTIKNVVYNYNEKAFIISGNTDDCDNFFVAFNTEGALYGSDGCGFLAGGTEEGDFVLTDDMLVVGDEYAYIVFMEGSVTFGSSVTGSNFTIDATTEETDVGLVLTTKDGSMAFRTDDGTVEFISNDSSVDVLTIQDPGYNYTDNAFVIYGSTDQCDDFFVAFNLDGSLFGSEDCGFVVGVSTTVDVVIGRNPDDEKECQSIVEIACGNSDFSELCDLINKFDDLKTSLESGTWTVFAPNNDAFDYYGDWLEYQSTETHRNILMFHIVEGQKLEIDDLSCGSGVNKIEMLNGKDTRTKCDDYVPLGQKGSGNDDEFGARFDTTDIQACNGVIHEIDDVLLYF